MHPKDAEGIANSVDPDQTAPSRSSLIWVCTVCPDPPVRKLRKITVIIVKFEKSGFTTETVKWVKKMQMECIKICRWNDKQSRPWSDRSSVWSGSTLVAQTCLSENLGSLWYLHVHKFWKKWKNNTVKLLNVRTPRSGCNHPKIWIMWFNHRMMRPNDADWVANMVSLWSWCYICRVKPGCLNLFIK